MPKSQLNKFLTSCYDFSVLKISRKLTYSFLIIATIGIIVVYVGISGTLTTYEALDIVVKETTQELILLGEIDSLSQKLLGETLSVALLASENPSDQHLLDELEELSETSEELERNIVSLKHVEDSLSDFGFYDDEQFVNELLSAKIDLVDRSHNLINAVEVNENSDVILSLKEELEDNEDTFEGLIESRLELEILELEQRNALADVTVANTQTEILVISVIGVVFAIVFGVIVSGIISKRLKILQDSAK